jgi:DNA-binding CsgD family transcriptional regulator
VVVGNPEIVGREVELAAIGAFLDSSGPSRALVLEGGAGIGKTTLWEAAVDAAQRRGRRVLSTRPSEAEAHLSFAALIDLLDGVDLRELGLPDPQSRALDVALLRAEPARRAPEPGAIALGFLTALRALAAQDQLAIALDDEQWLDAPSVDVLTFTCRRLRDESILLLVTRRPGPPSVLDEALAADAVRLELGPLSFGATRSLLSTRLGLNLPRQVLRRLVDTTLGNPLFALTVGQTISDDGVPAPGDGLPVPDTVEDLLGTRVSRLPTSTRRLLLAVALSADLRTTELATVAGTEAVEDAVAAGVLVVDGDRVRASHPLLAAAARKRSRARTRRELHLALAGAVGDDALRAVHLALATDVPDDMLAETLSRASAAAAARGAAREAVELAQHALRLTPSGSPARSERLLTLAGHLDLAGDARRVTELLTPEFDMLPRGAARVRAQLLLSEGGGVKSVADHQRHLEAALDEARDDSVLRAHVLAKKSIHATAACVERVEEAEAWALEALRAGTADPEVERLALHALAWARALAGRRLEDLGERFHAVSGAAYHLIDSVDRVGCLRLTWRGEIEASRGKLEELLALADERGELWSYVVVRLHLCELELRAGNLERASRLLEEWAESSEGELLVAPSYERCRALLAVGRGDLDGAAAWAARALAGADATGARWQLLETLRAKGTAALLAHDPEHACKCLRRVWAHTAREGVDDPGAFPVAPDLVEALVESGALVEAHAVTDRLRSLAERQAHPWGHATATRCDALVKNAEHDGEPLARLEEAAAAYGELGLHFDRARTLLLLGRAQRRRKKWAAARRALEESIGVLEELGSPGWVEEARSELARVGARRPQQSGELTPAERRVVELAVEGRSNKEIAHVLFVSVKTVEGHLSHAYAKLGVRSRVQLARRLERG